MSILQTLLYLDFYCIITLVVADKAATPTRESRENMTAPEFLDVSKLPFSRVVGEGETAVDLADVIQGLRPTMQLWQGSGLVKTIARDGTLIENFGFAMADPYGDHHAAWDDPYSLAWLVGGWGPLRDRYIANALRKMRAAAREGFNTLYLKHDCDRNEVFRNVVESVEDDGRFRWGDFPHGGAVSMEMRQLNLLGAVSVYDEDEDCVAATPPLAFVGMHLHRATLPIAA